MVAILKISVTKTRESDTSIMSSVCRPTETAAYNEYDVSLYSWIMEGLIGYGYPVG